MARLADQVYTPDGSTMELVNMPKHPVFTESLSEVPTASLWMMYMSDGPVSTMLFTPDHPA